MLMKSCIKTLLAIVLSMAFFSSTAQEKTLIYGLKGGINLSQTLNTINTKSKLGLVAGLTVDYNLNGNFYISSGLEYVPKGHLIDGGTGNGDRVNLNYLQLPVHFAYRYVLSSDVKIIADIGPYFAYGLSGKIKYKAIGSIEAYEVEAFGDGLYKRFDVGVGIGLGIDVKQINLRLGYDYGLSTVNDFQSIGNLRTSSLVLTIGYRL